MPTLLEVMERAGRLFGSATSGTADTGSTTQMLLDADLRNLGVDSTHLSGVWILRPVADAGDMQRQAREEPFRTGIGGIEVTVPWTAAPALDEAYYLFQPVPALPDPSAPASWKLAVNLGLGEVYFEDRVTLTVVPGQTKRFTMAAIGDWTPTPQAIKRIVARTDGVEYIEYDANKRGLSAQAFMDAGVLTIETSFAAPSGGSMQADILRPHTPLDALDDETPCDLELAAKAAVWQLHRLLQSPEQDEIRAWRQFSAAYTGYSPRYKVTV